MEINDKDLSILDKIKAEIIIGCSHPGVNNTTNRCIGCGKLWKDIYPEQSLISLKKSKSSFEEFRRIKSLDLDELLKEFTFLDDDVEDLEKKVLKEENKELLKELFSKRMLLKEKTIYKYKKYKKVGEDLIFEKELTREEFEIERKEDGSWKSMGHSGLISLRETDVGIAYLESSKKEYFQKEKKKLRKMILKVFIKKHNIKRVKAFLYYLNNNLTSGMSFRNAMNTDMDTLMIDRLKSLDNDSDILRIFR
jgi:hypothetical protein